MGFLYFFPGVKENGLTKANMLGRLGLPYLDGVDIRKGESLAGPEKSGGGVVVSYGDTRPQYLPDSQTWSRAPVGDFFLGHAGDPPSPNDLARAKQIPGYTVPLTDGNQWHVPIALATSDDSERYCALPRVSEVQPDGTWANSRVRSDHVRLWDIACKWWDILAASAADGKTDYSFDQENEWCVEALQCNYLVGVAEVSYLGLLDDDSRGEILSSLVDLPKLIRLADEAEKKTTEREPELVASG